MDRNSLSEILSDRRLLRMVQFEARRLAGPCAPEEDLFQSGLVGALHAFKAFDPSFGASFHTYARFRVRSEIQRAAREAQEVVLSERVVRFLSRADRVRLQPGATRAEVAQAVGVPEAVLEELTFCREATFDVEVEVADPDAEAWVAGQLDQETLAQQIQVVMDLLAARSARDARLMDVVRRRYGMRPYPTPQSRREVGAAYGVTTSRVSQVFSDAMALLGQSLPPKLAQTLR